MLKLALNILQNKNIKCINERKRVEKEVNIYCLLLPLFYNVSHSMLMNLDRYIYMYKFININMNVKNARMTYIVK